MSPVQPLPSFNLALYPDHYKTVLPNLSYPSRPITHIPWAGSSAPLLFSVNQSLFFYLRATFLLFFALRKPRVQRRHSLLVLLMFKLVIYLIFRFSSDTDVNPFTPISGSYSHHCEYMFRHFFSPRCFLWGRHADLGEVDWCLVRVRSSSDFLVFFVAQVVNGRSKTQTKALWRLEPRVRVPHRHFSNPLLFGFTFPFRF